MRLRGLCASMVVALLAACDFLDGAVGPGDLVAFASAKSRWDARPFQDYSYEVRTFCFCPPEIGQWTRVSVRDGVVTDVNQVEPNPQLPITTNHWQPMDSLFARLHRAMGESSFGSHYAQIVVEYDAELGYPRHIEYRSKPNIADAGSVVEVRNVTPLN